MHKIYLFFSAIFFYSISSFGQAGIGATPTTVAGIGPGKFEVTGVGDFTIKVKGDSYTGFGVQSFRDSDNDHAMINLFGARGTMSSPSAILSGDNVSTISSRAYTGGGYTPITSIQSYYTGSNQGTITFSTNGGSGIAERIRISHSGNVGLGTSNPETKLHLSGGYFRVEHTSPVYIDFKHSGAPLNNKIARIGNDNGNMIFDMVNDAYSISTERMRITNAGKVGIGTNTPSATLQVSGDIIANSIAGSSDIRFKTNIKNIESPLKKVIQLRGVTFNWKTKEFIGRNFSHKQSLGFIAQEVEKVIPEVIETEKTKEGFKSVQYDKVVALLVEAIKEQQKQIDSLNNKVNNLIKKYNK